MGTFDFRLWGQSGKPSAGDVNGLRRLDRQKLLCGLAQHRSSLSIAQTRGGQDVVDRGLGPGKRKVCAHNYLTRADFGDEVTQAFGCEDYRIVIKLPQGAPHAEERMVCVTLRWREMDSNFQYASTVRWHRAMDLPLPPTGEELCASSSAN